MSLGRVLRVHHPRQERNGGLLQLNGVAKITDGEGIQYFFKDHLGSSTVVTNDSGAIVEQADYRPFGEDRFYTETASAPYQYTDQEMDTSPQIRD